MEIRQYLQVLKRRAWLVILFAIVAGVVAYFISNSMIPIYRSTSRYLIDQPPGSASSNEYSQLLTEQILAQTYVEIATTRPVLEETITRLNLPFSAGKLRSMLSVNARADRQIMVISVEDTDPERAAAIANTLGEVFVAKNQERDNLRYAEPINNWQERMDVLNVEINELEIDLGGTRRTGHCGARSGSGQTAAAAERSAASLHRGIQQPERAAAESGQSEQ
jgi:non-specific protein-tyrosine kinase